MVEHHNTRKIHRVTGSWLVLMLVTIVIGAAMVLVPLSLLLSGAKYDGTPEGLAAFAVVSFLLSIFLLFCVSGYVITSPRGLEYIMPPGVWVKLAWADVARVDANPFGVVNLIVRRPLSADSSAHPLAWLLGGTRMIQLSPYMGDWGQSELWREILKHAPHAVDEVLRLEVQQQMRYAESAKSGRGWRWASYLRSPGTILLYLLALLLLAVPVQQLLKPVGERSAQLALVLELGGFSWAGSLMTTGVMLLAFGGSLRRSAADGRPAVSALAFYAAPLAGYVTGLVLGLLACAALLLAGWQPDVIPWRIRSTLDMVALIAGWSQLGWVALSRQFRQGGAHWG